MPEDKRTARAYFLGLRLEISDDRLQEKSFSLCKSLSELDEFKKADTLLLFSSTRNEPDLTYLAELAFSKGKNVAFPISLTDSLTLDFRCVSSLSELIVGTYGIKEPSANAKKATFSATTLCIVPALAFDEKGFRLGYGKGYYDRFLKDFCGISAGIVLDGFLVTSLPKESTDIPVNILITETGVFNTK